MDLNCILSSITWEIISFCATAGNVYDRKPVDKLTQGMHGMVFDDRGYLAKWLADLKEHTRHCSIINFAVNLISGLIAYTQKQKKPTADFKYTKESTLAF